MKQKVSPAIGAIVVTVVFAVAAFFVYRFATQGSVAASGEKPPGMPSNVASEFQKRMGTSSPTGAQGIKGSNPGGPGSGYLAPPSR